MFGLSRVVEWLCRAFALSRRELARVEMTLLGLGLLLTFATCAISWEEMRNTCGIDLRNRVVGSRVMLAGYDPYTFVWEPGMPEEWHDPIRAAGDYPKLHRLTVPPATLCLYAPIAHLPYRTIRQIQFVCEWMALLASICLLVRTIPQQKLRVPFLLCTVALFVISQPWHAHLWAGQMYSVHLLMLSLGLYFCSRLGLSSVCAGLAFGTLVLMRPNLMLFAAGFLALGKWRTAITMMAFCIIGAIAMMPLMASTTWSSYLSMGDKYYTSIWNPDALPSAPPLFHADDVEGMNIAFTPGPRASTSFPILYEKLRNHFGLPLLDLGRTCKLLMIVVGLVLFFLLLFRPRVYSQRSALLLIVTLCLDTEFLLPQRWAYVDVILLAPLALAFPLLVDQKRFASGALFLVLLGLVSGQIGQHFLSFYVASSLRSWLVMGGLTALAICRWRMHQRISDDVASVNGESEG